MKTKLCPSCNETRPATEFGRNQSLGDGLSFYCKVCNRARSNAHNRKRRAAMGKEVRDHSWVPEGFRWCPSCEQPVAHKDYSRNSRAPHGFGSQCKACKSESDSAAYFYRRYKLTRASVDRMRTAQDDRCAICGDPQPQHLDHDHSTGAIRRLLCQRCNHGLGLFRDDPYLLHVAALYVTGHRQQHAFMALAEAAGDASEGANRPSVPPVGSDRRPGGHGTTAHSTGRNSRSRRREQAREADE
jgi:hypothetical protein